MFCNEVLQDMRSEGKGGGGCQEFLTAGRAALNLGFRFGGLVGGRVVGAGLIRRGVGRVRGRPVLQGWAQRSFPFRTFRSFPLFSRVFGDL